jgi:polyprenyl P-hydroxybenzoate/phenylacrylic acid decarboxylase-like protein
MSQLRVIVGISGASGAAIGLRVLERLAETDLIETHLVISPAAERTLAAEIGPEAPTRARDLAFCCHDHRDIGASIASGSFVTAGMVVAPCSMKTLASIALGFADNLVSRAADVALKERRRLVLMARETPLNLAHLRNMTAVTEMGGVICPPVPAFYQRPESLSDVVDHSVARVLDLFGIEATTALRRWQGLRVTDPA